MRNKASLIFFWTLCCVLCPTRLHRKLKDILYNSWLYRSRTVLHLRIFSASWTRRKMLNSKILFYYFHCIINTGWRKALIESNLYYCSFFSFFFFFIHQQSRTKHRTRAWFPSTQLNTTHFQCYQHWHGI